MFSHRIILRGTAKAGFTLVELLVATGIIAVLAASGAVYYQRSLESAKSTREMAAGKSLIGAYLAAAADNDGRLMPGMDFSVNRVYYQPYDREITTIHVANRYPYRLAPYFDYRFEGVIIVNQDPSKIKTDYNKSAFPAFGINHQMVGGNVAANGQINFPSECVTRLPQIDHPLVVFASGATGTGNDYVSGYNILDFPANWRSSNPDPSIDAGEHGNVDARFNGKAMAVFSDGSIVLRTLKELADMRLWCANAASQNDPNYVPARN